MEVVTGTDDRLCSGDNKILPAQTLKAINVVSNRDRLTADLLLKSLFIFNLNPVILSCGYHHLVLFLVHLDLSSILVTV